MKKTVSLLLAFLFVFLMSACGAKEDETTTAKTTTAKTTEAAPVTETTAPEITRTQAEIDEIIAGIKKACVLSTVLDKYGSYVLDTGYIDSGCLYYYFLKNGKIAYIAETDILGAEFIYDIYYGDKYYKGCRGYGERMSAYFYLDPMCLYLTPQDEEEVAAGFIDDDEKVFPRRIIPALIWSGKLKTVITSAPTKRLPTRIRANTAFTVLIKKRCCLSVRKRTAKHAISINMALITESRVNRMQALLMSIRILHFGKRIKLLTIASASSARLQL